MCCDSSDVEDTRLVKIIHILEQNGSRKKATADILIERSEVWPQNKY